MKHYGDVSKIEGSQVEPVDIITIGSPCQDLSVAGKRAGIQDGERSNLFFEAVRIIKEMRDSTNGEYPKYAVWENVPGAFSSNKGHDFHAVLEAFCAVCDDTVSIPKPYDAKRTKLVWSKAGEIVGDNYSVAWRTLDAQYWGAPQRRKRIYLVADFGGQRAGEILFKPEGLRGDMQEGDETWQGAAADAVGSVDGSNGNGGQLAATLISSYGTKWNGNAGAYNGENFVLQKHSVDGSVGAAGVVSKGNGDCFIMPERHMSLSVGGGQAGQGYPCVLHGSVGVECLGFDMYNQSSTGDKTRTLKTPAGGDDLPVIVLKERAGCEGGGKGALWSDKAFTLATNQDMSVIALQANGIDQADTVDRHAVCYPLNEQIILRHGALGRNTGFGAGNDGDPAYTLQANHPHAVCFENHQHGGYREGCETLRASGGDYGGGSENIVCYDARGNGDGETACTITGDHQNRITDYTAVAVQEAKGEKECEYGAKAETNADKILQALWEEVGAKKVAEWGFRILNSFQQKGVLRPCLHGKSVSDGGNGVNKVDSPAPNEPQEKAERELRGVRSEKCARCTPQRWKPSEQQLGEFTAHLQELSQQDSSAEGVLHHMWEANERAWLLRKALSEIQNAREPICNKNQPIQRRYIIRRLLPVECAKLQGFLDTWGNLAPYDPADAEFWEDVRKTHAEINGKKYKPVKDIKKWYDKLHTDSAEYKMWGNGIALPCAEYVICGIAERGANTLGSLFDGSGGFPLAGVLNGIEPVWASEVEPYPIAVTKSRFKEAPNE